MVDGLRERIDKIRFFFRALMHFKDFYKESAEITECMSEKGGRGGLELIEHSRKSATN